MKIGADLFFRKGDIPDVISGAPGKVTVNLAGPDGLGNSEHSTGSHRAKISNILPIFIGLMDGKYSVAGVSTEPAINGVYVETTKDGTLTSFLWKETSVMVSKTDPELYAKALAACAYMLTQDDPRFEEFKKAYTSCASAYKSTGKIKFEDALLLCDSFYYTLRATYLYDKGIEIPTEDETLSEETISQLGRSLLPPYQMVDMQTPIPSELKKMQLDEDTTSASTTTSSTSTLYEQAIAGELILPYEFDEEGKQNIPPLSELEYFIPTEKWEHVLTIIRGKALKILDRMNSGETGVKAIQNDGAGMILTGDPGTGKTTILKAVCAALGLPLYSIPIEPNSEEDKFQGMLKLSQEKDQPFRLVETPFVKAFMHGGLVVLEEYNLAEAAVLMGAIGQGIEKPYHIFKDGIEEIVRHPMCFLTSTCNIGTQGSQPQNEAFDNRQPTVIIVDDPEEKAFLDLLVQMTGANKKDAKKVYRTYKSIMQYLGNQENEELVNRLSLRNCAEALNIMQMGIDTKSALTYTLVNPIALRARDVAAEIKAGFIDTAFD